jgi:hypothetical protein
MARSGTTWLGRTLAEHPDIAVFGETSFWGRLHVPPASDGLYGEKQLARVQSIQRMREWRVTTYDDSGILKRTRPDQYSALIDSVFAEMRPPIAPADVFRRIALALAQSEGKSHVVEKTPHHIHWLPEIAALFPQSKFVVLARDPAGFMLSYLHLGNRLESPLQRALDRSWRHPLIAAVAWRAYMHSIASALAEYGDRIELVATRELRESPREVLKRVQSFLGVDVYDLAPVAPPRGSSFDGRRRPELESEDVFWIGLVAGDLARRNGYEIASLPRRPLRIAASVLLVPFVAIVTAVRLPWIVRRSFGDYLSRWLRVPRNSRMRH